MGLVYSPGKGLSTPLLGKQPVSVRRRSAFGVGAASPKTEHRTPNTASSPSLPAADLLHQPLEERLVTGGHLVQGIAQQPAEREGEAPAGLLAHLRRQCGAAVEEVADGV